MPQNFIRDKLQYLFMQVCLLFYFIFFFFRIIKPLSAKITKWSNTLKQFVGNLPTNCLSMFDHFVGLAHKGLSLEKLKILYMIICRSRSKLIHVFRNSALYQRPMVVLFCESVGAFKPLTIFSIKRHHKCLTWCQTHF